MKYLAIIFGTLALLGQFNLHAQVSWREATPAEAAAGTMGPPAVLTPRRGGGGTNVSYANVNFTNVAFYGSVTGLASAIPTNYTIIPDFRIGESSWTSNGISVLGAPINVTTNYNHWVLHAKNSSGSVLAIVPRAEWKTNGVWNYTNLSLIHLWIDDFGTNAICVPVK